MNYNSKILNNSNRNISYKFYFRYWLKNTIMACATGFVIGIIIPVFPFRQLGGTISGLLVYQIIVLRYFWGNRRGDFEYVYREIFLEKLLKQIIIKKYDKITYYRFYFDQFNSISSYQSKTCQKLLSDNKILKNNNFVFPIFLKAAKIALKESNFKREIKYLKKALDIYPNDLVANCKLAVAMERIGACKDATNAYKAAINDPLIKSDKINEFLKVQIQRIQSKGPNIKRISPGLRDTIQ